MIGVLASHFERSPALFIVSNAPKEFIYPFRTLDRSLPVNVGTSLQVRLGSKIRDVRVHNFCSDAPLANLSQTNEGPAKGKITFRTSGNEIELLLCPAVA